MMAVCPFAVQEPMPGFSGTYTSGPFKIVHHTTEGHSAADAFAAYRKHKSAPHFTVDESTIYQHFDTSTYSRSLRNAGGGVQTNRDSAVQIELVGFAHRPKDGRTLALVARLCRWIEAEHGVAQDWPNGLPKTATPAGKDPGGHNRDAGTWDVTSGHYGHSQVPENTHWDPAYTKDEVDLIMAEEDAVVEMLGVEEGSLRAETFRRFGDAFLQRPNLTEVVTTMPDHSHGMGED